MCCLQASKFNFDIKFIFRTKIATVEILREIELSDPLYDIRLLSRDRLRPFHPEECESESDKNNQESDKNKQESENGEQSGSSSRYFQLCIIFSLVHVPDVTQIYRIILILM